VTPADIEAQVGAAAGLWTHSPTDWAGNEGVAKPASFPLNASQGYRGAATGSRPGQEFFASVPPTGGVAISAVSITALAATTASIQFTLSSLPTVAARVNYGTTQAMSSSTAAGSAASGTQTIALSGLTTKTLYYFQVTATNANGSTLTSIGTFTTL
jgi:hypothetical protein